MDDETLVGRRPKRSTAGNRMEAALAELALEDPKDLEEDNDFVNDKEEEDIFESDFASTDEEAAQEDIDTGDNAVREDERRERKSARSRMEQATKAAHARQIATFNPQSEAPSSNRVTAPKIRRRVALGTAVDVETGEVIEGTKRKSRRTHTVMNTSATVNRIKNAEVKKAAVPKKARVITRAPTQDELIAQALDTEEGNIVEHRDYLKLEDEKRARAHVVRPTVEGPLLRWISRKEEVKIPLPPPVLQPQYSFLHGTPGTSTPSTSIFTYSSPFQTYSGPSSSNAPSIPSTATDQANGESAASSTRADIPHIRHPNDLSTPIQPPDFYTDVVCKNYVIHERSQSNSSTKPLWKDTMAAMFGDHVRWEELRVFTGKQRPLSRPHRTCPITGLTAKYLDPRTGVPFANTDAYCTLTKMLNHEYVWSDALGCYISTPGTTEAPVVGEPSNKRRKSYSIEDEGKEI
ncbi:YL1 nuclear protein-domain-containing protein [Hygrophoropsis aurantiaca]|uniref:YL1 nuclear protein-domain-containing protein n=1 Tax=Hygrophoropsis aurantiaca TaxID=72124 RepID=A0ACB8AAC8_9AGAM|nr:YL1 nuclear protein-domain-containing protein [Hygrophoropsis aurantiaca]